MTDRTDDQIAQDYSAMLNSVKVIESVLDANNDFYNEKTNLEVVETICDLLEELAPEKPVGVKNYRDLITFVKDRPGHDARYAIDASKINKELGWSPTVTFEEGLSKTIDWYLNNKQWLSSVSSGNYQHYYKKQYAKL